MAILQGTPIGTTNGIHPFVALMAQGQQGINQGINLTAQSVRDRNQTSNQFVRDALAAQIDGTRIKLQREQMAQQKEQQAAQLSLQERQLDQRASEFQQTLGIRQQEAQQQRTLKDRELQIQGIRGQAEMAKLRRQERNDAAIMSLLGGGGEFNPQFPQVGPMPDNGGVLPPLGDETGYTGMPPSLAGQLGYPQQPAPNNFVQDFVQQGMPQSGLPAAPQSESTQAPEPASQQDIIRQSYQKQILGLKIAAMSNPSSAGYAIQKIGEIEGKMAQEMQVQAAGGESGQVSSIVNEHVVPFTGLTGGPPTKDSVNQFWNNAKPELKAAIVGNDEEWDKVITNREANRSNLFDVRSKIDNELLARDRGAAEARFLAKNQFKEAGDQYVQAVVDSNPFYKRLQTRKEQLDNVINDDMKNFADGPSQAALLKANDIAAMVVNSRDTVSKMESQLESQWKTFDKKLYARDYKSGIEVGGFKMVPLKEEGKSQASNEAFNKNLAAYAKEKNQLKLREDRLRGGLEVLKNKAFNVSDIEARVFGSASDDSSDSDFDREMEDFQKDTVFKDPNRKDEPLIKPMNPMDKWLQSR